MLEQKERPDVVPSIGDTMALAPSELRIFMNPTSDADPKVNRKEMLVALLGHCRASRDQVTALGI